MNNSIYIIRLDGIRNGVIKTKINIFGVNKRIKETSGKTIWRDCLRIHCRLEEEKSIILTEKKTELQQALK